MSDRHQPSGHGARAEEDRISTSSIVAVGLGALVLFFLASLITITYFRVTRGDLSTVPIPPEVGRSKIEMVEQQLFDLAERGGRDRAARLERLRTYGWVDRGEGIVRLPIDRAMDLVAKGVRAAPTAPPGAGTRTLGGQP